MNSAVDYKNEGNEALKAGNLDLAIEKYTKAIELDSTNHVFYSNRSNAYTLQNKYQEALDDAVKCIEVNPQFVKGYCRKGLALFKMGKMEESVKAYDEGLAVLPGNELLLKDKASVEAQMKPAFDMSKMMELMNNPMVKEMMEKNPQLAAQLLQNPQLFQNPEMMNMMANMFNKQGGQQGDQQANPQQTPPPQPTQTNQPAPEQTKPAEPEVSEFDKTKKEADNFYKTKQFEKAIEQYNKCIELDGSQLLVRNNKAACFILLNKLDDALETVNEAIKLYKETDPSKRDYEHIAKLLARKARIYHLKKDFDQAIDLYNESLLENRVPRIASELKDVQREKRKAEEIAYINPEKSEEHREKGNEYYKAGDYAKAVEEYEEAVRRNPKDKRVYNNLAACFSKMLKFNESMKYADLALELDPNFVKALIRKATVYQVTKEYHKAIEHFEKVLKLDPENNEAKQGIRVTQGKIAMGMQGGNDEERMKKAMSDPEIQSIMGDPMMKIALEQMQANPQKAMEYFNDPTLGPKLQKLIQAGIIKTG